MSYYYEDISHYSYTTPTYYEDTSSYSYNEPTHYDTPSDPIYYEDVSSEPVYCEDIHPEPVYLDDRTTWSLTTSPTSYEVECELEAYAEAASNRTYFEDEVHPAYRDNPDHDDHVDLFATVEPPEDEIHSTYQNYPMDISYVNPPTTAIENPWDDDHHYKSYTWIRREFEGGIVKYDEPRDPSFYIPSSHNNAPDGDLAETIERTKALLDDYSEWFTREADDHDLIEEWQPEVDRLTRVLQHTEEIQTRRRTYVNYDDRQDCKDDNGNPQLQSTFSIHHNADHGTVTTPPSDICIPNPLPLSPNIRFKTTRLTSAFLIAASKRREPRYHFGSPPRRRRSPKHNTRNHWNKTRTVPPAIRPPKPHPLAPNIHTQSHLHLILNNHPPDIRPPKPFPPAPNILTLFYRSPQKYRNPQSYSTPQLRPPSYQQPRRPAYTRPPRKHPPASIPTPHSVDRRHNAIRRILKKNCPHSL
jgi:hypothetical protein